MNRVEFAKACRSRIMDNASIEVTTIDDAYKLQREVAKSFTVGAWKLGGSTKNTRRVFNTNEVYYGPLQSDAIYVSQGLIRLPKKMTNPVGEVEICFVLSEEVGKLSAESVESDEILKYIQSACVGVELPWSNFDLPDAGLNTLIADCCASGALILGQMLQLSDVSNGELEVTVETELLAHGDISNILGGPISALRAFFQLASKHQLTLKPGQIVATGGATPCISLPKNRDVIVNLNGSKVLAFKLTD